MSRRRVTLVIDEHDVVVIGDYFAGCSGNTSGLPGDCEPGEPPSFEAERVLFTMTDTHGATVTLNAHELPCGWLREQFCEDVDAAALEQIEKQIEQQIEQDKRDEAAIDSWHDWTPDRYAFGPEFTGSLI